MRTSTIGFLLLFPTLAFGQSNRVRWDDFQHLPPGDCSASIAINADTIIVAGATASGNAVRALMKGTGTPIWSTPIPNCATMAAAAGRVYVAGRYPNPVGLSAFDATTGAFLWNIPGAMTSQQSIVRSHLVANENAVVITSFDTQLTQAYDPVDGHFLWSIPLGGIVAIDGFQAYVANPGPFVIPRTVTLQSRDARTGNLNWQYVRPNASMVSLAVGPSRLYIGGNSFTMALESGSGDLLWQDQNFGGWLGVSRGILGVANGHIVRTYQAESGIVLWSDTVTQTEGYPEPVQYRGFNGLTMGDDGLYVAGILSRQPGYHPTVLRAYGLDSGAFLFEDVFNNGGVTSLPPTVIRDGSSVFVSSDAVFGPAAHNLDVREYEFGDIEVGRANLGIVGRGSGPEPESRSRVRR